MVTEVLPDPVILSETLKNADPLMVKYYSIVKKTLADLNTINKTLEAHETQAKLFEEEVKVLKDTVTTLTEEVATLKKNIRANNLTISGLPNPPRIMPTSSTPS